MPDSSQNHIFISYSHTDKHYRDKLDKWLKPYLTSTDAIVWSDGCINPSEEWHPAIKSAITNSFSAILLVTQEFLNSEFIMEKELPLLVEAAKEGRLQLTWIAVEESAVDQTEISKIQSLNNPSSPIATFDEQARNTEWKKVCERIKELATNRIQPAPPSSPSLKEDDGPIVIGSPFPGPSTFRNREEETAKLSEQLAGTKAFVYVVGPMGVGKTALLSKFCEQVESGEIKLNLDRKIGGADGIVRFTFRNGEKKEIERLYEEISQLISEDLAREVNQYWQDATRDERDKFSFILSKLPGKRCLLAIDNFEVVLESDGKISDPSLATFFDVCLQTSGHGLRIVATSREAILIDVKLVGATLPLPLSKGLPKEEAMQMLRELLNSLDPLGDLGPADTPDAQIEMAVSRCDCLPSALQIIAGILSESITTLSLHDILKDDDLFKSGLKKMVQEQLEIQSGGKSLVLQALSVFGSPVPADAVTFLLEPHWDKSSSESIGQCLNSLIRSFFLFFEKENKTFQLEPIKRECAYELIPNTDDEYSRRKCHLRAAEYFRSVREREKDWKTLDDLQPLMDEFDQLILAEQFNEAAVLVDTIDKNYMWQWGHYRMLGSMREKLREHLMDPLHVVENLGRLCAVNRKTGKREEAIEAGEEAVKICRELGDKSVIANWIGELGDAYADAGEFPKAIEAYEEACKIARENEDPEKEAWNLGGLAILFRQSGRVKEALDCYNRGIEVALKFSNEEMRGRFICNRTMADIAKGDYSASISDCDESLEIAERLGNATYKAFTLHHRARAMFQRRDFAESKRINMRALKICAVTKERRCEAFIRKDIGFAEHQLRNLESAEKQYCDAFKFNEIEVSHICATKLGIVFLERGDGTEAEKWFLIAIDRCKRLLKIKDDYEALYQLSISQLAMGDDETKESYNLAFKMSSHCGTLMEAWLDLELLERAAPETTGIEEVKSLFRKAAENQNCRSFDAP